MTGTAGTAELKTSFEYPDTDDISLVAEESLIPDKDKEGIR